MKIQLKIYDSGGIDCLSDSCAFKRECANHKTAGEFRSEGGFTPELYEKHGEYFCETCDREIDEDIRYACFPVDSDKLGQGEILLTDLQTKSCINYQI